MWYTTTPQKICFDELLCPKNPAVQLENLSTFLKLQALFYMTFCTRTFKLFFFLFGDEIHIRR